METKILQTINRLRKKLDTDWKPALEDMNIFENVQAIYFKFTDNRVKANTILAYIVYSYHKDSNWLDLHADRTDNKIKIMSSLAGDNFRTDEDYVEAVSGILPPYNLVIEWLINHQMDRRWSSIVADYDFHSRAQVISKNVMSVKDMADAGKMLQAAEQRMERADKNMEILRNENVKLDSALKKEDRETLTERKPENYLNWEFHILKLNSEKDLDRELGDPLSEYEEVN